MTDDLGFLFTQFVSEKESQGLSPQSIINYKVVFERYQKDINRPISKDSFQKWVNILLANKMNPISINFYIIQLRVFAYWLMRNGYLEAFPIKPLKSQEPKPKVFSNEELLKLLEKPAKTSSFADFRTWTIINLIVAVGARASTVINIKIVDLDFESKQIIYRHLKNKSLAMIPMSPTLEKILKQYLNTWDINCEYLFPERYGSQMTGNALIQTIRQYCKKRGVKPQGPHALRHTFAKQFILNGGNAFILQRMLTHSDLTMTKKYVRLFASDMQNGFNDYCPLDRLVTSGYIKRKI